MRGVGVLGGKGDNTGGRGRGKGGEEKGGGDIGWIKTD